jgi:hypothetical protein
MELESSSYSMSSMNHDSPNYVILFNSYYFLALFYDFTALVDQGPPHC